MALHRFRRQYEQLLQFERGRIIGMMVAGWSTRRVALQLGLSDCVGTSGSERCHLHQDQVQDALDRPVIEKTATSDESRFNLKSEDNRVRVWRPRGERLNLVFTLQRHIAPTPGVVVWGATAYNTWSPLVLIRGTMAAQRYVHDILQPHFLSLMQWLPGAIFQQDNAPSPTARVSQDCLRNCYYPSLACPIPIFVSNRAYLGSFMTASWASHEFE
ncbi:transposable element Tcb1 transposase [Trichonephila clavipes]|nr:transposable element Tcb1 transposase [Trichonephila clavipes]